MSSGKTYSIIQVLFTIACEEQNAIITVTAQDFPNLRKGALRQAKIIFTENFKEHFRYKETDHTFTNYITGSIIEFVIFKDEQDAKGPKRTHLFINEANAFEWPVFWQLSKRTSKKVFIDYNPSSRFWAHDKLIGTNDTKLIISDHRHNPFLSPQQHYDIESIDDEELFKVYARGKTGKIEGLVYLNWTLCDNMPDDYKKRWIGIDFGFTNDPTSIIDVRLSGGELWIDEIEYTTNLTNIDIANIIESNGLSSIQAVADSAEPKSIQELKNKRIRIEAAKKGPDSLKNGIDILKRYKMNVTRKSTNVHKELLSYKWKHDNSGNATNIPVDKFNHALDAIRYVALNYLSNNNEGVKVSMLSRTRLPSRSKY